MTPITIARIGLAVVGILVWGYGTHTDDEVVRWFGVAFFAAALLLRFLPERR